MAVPISQGAMLENRFKAKPHVLKAMYGYRAGLALVNRSALLMEPVLQPRQQSLVQIETKSVSASIHGIRKCWSHSKRAKL